jgi:hypothetical protein
VYGIFKIGRCLVIPSTIVHNVTLKEFLKLKAECFDL